MDSNDDNYDKDKTIIIDNGSFNSKVGFSGYDEPTIIRTCVGYPKYSKTLEYHSTYYEKNECFIGDLSIENRGISKINYPIKYGDITSLNELEIIWDYFFKEVLHCDPDSHRIILTEPCNNKRKNREEITKFLFETYNIPALYFANQAILALNSTGRSTGIVVESGDGVTQIAPVYCNYCISHAIKRTKYAGKDLTDFMLNLLSEIGLRFSTSSEKDITKSIKESACYVAQNYEEEKKFVEDHEIMLPDGKKIVLKEQRIKCPEVLFNPKLIYIEDDDIVTACYNSIQKCDIDIKEDMYYNIILSGGNTNFKGFKTRFESEMGKIVPKSMTVKVSEVEDKICSVWKGAKTLSQLPDMESNWITKKEFEDYGSQIIHRKCF